MRVLTALLVACAIVIPSMAFGQAVSPDADSHPAMSHSHGLELGLGLLAGVSAGTSAEPGGVSVNSDVGGFMGSLTYLYRLDDRILLTASGGALSVDARVSAMAGGSSVESSTVSMLLLGARYLFSGLGERRNVRPYVSVAVGPYVGHTAEVRAGPTTSVGSRTDVAPGARLGLGLTAGLNSWLTLGVGAGYHLVADFNQRIGAESNYSNPDFLLSIGWRFGAAGYR